MTSPSTGMRSVRTFDTLLQMKDAGAVTASAGAQVDGSAKVLDIGVGYLEASVVIDVSAIDNTSADEKYEIEWQLSNTADFSAGVIVASVLKLGDSSTNGGSADSVAGRYTLCVTNEFVGTLYRYARLYHRIAGTTPSINYSAYLAKDAY